jgi:hypothetical protein
MFESFVYPDKKNSTVMRSTDGVTLAAALRLPPGPSSPPGRSVRGVLVRAFGFLENTGQRPRRRPSWIERRLGEVS